MKTWQSIMRYFDLAADVPRIRQRDGEGKERRIGVLPQYVTVVLGIVVQPIFETFRRTGAWEFGGFTTWLPFALVVSLLIFPGVYRKVWDPEKPTFVQLCSIFAAGMGWEAALSTGMSAVGVG